MKNFHHFGVIGAGAWGTALAQALLRAGRDVTLWAHQSADADIINTTHENKTYLPGIALDPRLRATASMQDVASCDAWLIVTPAQHVRATAKQLAKLGPTSCPVIIAAKGIEQTTAQLLSEITASELPNHPIAIMSGPSFAHEVARGLPAALTLAIQDQAIGENLMQAMASSLLRLYLTDDTVGAQIGGAIKNVIAVACGVIAGRNLGENARAAIITRGLAEMMRLGTALGGKAATLMGLSGLGDMVLTCSSTQSRNMSLGIALGRGEKLADILAKRASVTEGVTTAAAALTLAQKHNIDMPIVTAVDAILSRNADIDTVIADLMSRSLKVE